MNRRALSLGLGLLLACGGAHEQPATSRTAPSHAATSQARPSASRSASLALGDHASGVTVLAVRPGVMAVATKDRLILLEADYLHLTALRPSDGKEIWRVKLEQKVLGADELVLRRGEVIVHAGDRLFFVDPRDGKVLRKSDGVPSCPFVENDGACAYECGCSLFVALCEDGVAVTQLRGKSVHIYKSLSGPHDTACAFAPRIAGRVGGHIVAAIGDGKGRGISEDGLVVLLDATTGAEVRRGPALRWRRDMFGVAVDTGGCWTADVDTGALTMSDCMSGAVRWRARVGAKDNLAELDVRTTPDGLMVRRLTDSGGHLALVDGKTGKLRWHREVPAGIAPFTADEDPGRLFHVPEKRGWELVNHLTGAPLAELPLADGESLRRVDGGFIASGRKELRRIDAGGHVLQTLAYDGGGMIALSSTHAFEVSRDRDELLLRRLDDLSVARSLPGSFGVLPTPSLPDRLKVLFRGEGEASEMVLVELSLP